MPPTTSGDYVDLAKIRQSLVDLRLTFAQGDWQFALMNLEIRFGDGRQMPTPEIVFLIRSIAAEFLPAICADVAATEPYVTVRVSDRPYIKLTAGHQMACVNSCSAVGIVEWIIGHCEFPSITKRLSTHKPFIRGMLRLATNNWARQTNAVAQFRSIIQIKQDPLAKNWSKDFDNSYPWLRFAQMAFMLFSLFLIEFPSGYDAAKDVWDEENSQKDRAKINPLYAYVSSLPALMEKDGEHAKTTMSLSGCLRLLTGCDDGDIALVHLIEGKSNREKTRQYLTDHEDALPRNARPMAVCGGCGLIAVNDEVRQMMLCSRCMIMHYCSVQCQWSHWRDDHAKHCNTLSNS